MACTVEEINELLGAELIVDVRLLLADSAAVIIFYLGREAQGPCALRIACCSARAGVDLSPRCCTAHKMHAIQRQPPSTDFISAQVDSAQPKTFPPAASGAGSQAERTTGEVVQTVRGYIERFCADVQSERNFFLKPETRHTMETILVTLLQTHAPSPLLANPASVSGRVHLNIH